MPFTSLDFALFLGFVILLNWRLRAMITPYPPFLLLASLIFYLLGAPKFVPLLLVVALANWAASSRMTVEASPFYRKMVLAADITFCLSLLAFFKYFEFFFTSAESLGLRLDGLLTLPDIVYPVGMSFFTFQGLSLAIDRYRQPDSYRPTLLETCLFVSFFPTVLSGPIQRFQPFKDQLKKTKPESADLNLALVLILSGLFKKVALSSYLSEHIVRGVFQVPESYSALGVLAGIYGYSAQIYLDFSGYSDLARGVGLLIGFEVGINFDSPYLTTNIRDFWRRWHISLSSWLRDYLYLPLGGSKKGARFLNLLITQTLGGLWHGAHLRYLVWGLVHGLVLAFTHLVRDARIRRLRAWEAIGFKSWQIPQPNWPEAKKFICFLLTFNFVSFTWILFRAESFQRAADIARLAFDPTRPGLGAPVLAWVLVFLTLFGQKVGGSISRFFFDLQAKMNILVLSLWSAFWVIIIIKLGPDGVLPFIYFQY
ncbi:MAG: MBOAT family protein [Deltaproteobacteria bacterium]|jgi:D-alanyl-lipoteichoic acid acyltransferase DltB (MBOAT superfamily)|nr:MBOAT family protein [Deltaproteobacteria bacterium]